MFVIFLFKKNPSFQIQVKTKNLIKAPIMLKIIVELKNNNYLIVNEVKYSATTLPFKKSKTI